MFSKLIQKELATMSGLTDATVRNYELGNGSPNKEQLRKIADVLNCDISALIDHEPNSIFEIMHIIFDYEKEIKFRPLIGNGDPTALLSHNPHFADFLLEWDEMRKKHYNGEIYNEELEYWKLSFPKKLRFLKKHK